MNRSAFLGAAMAVGLLTCVGAGAAEPSRLRITWVHSNAASPSEQRVQAGFSAWLKETRQDWQVTYLDAGGSAEKTASNVQDAVTRAADAVIVTMADLHAAKTALAMAKEHAVPVFAVDSGVVPGIIVDVASDDRVMAAEVSHYLLDRIGGRGSIIFLRIPATGGTRTRGQTMAALLRTYPNVEVLAERDIDPDNASEDTERAMRDYATRFGHGITAVWAPEDVSATAAVKVLEASGITAWVTGMDGQPSAVAMVCDPHSPFLATVKQPFEVMGAKTGAWIQAVVGEKRDPAVLFPDKEVDLPAELITKPSCAKP